MMRLLTLFIAAAVCLNPLSAAPVCSASPVCAETPGFAASPVCDLVPVCMAAPLSAAPAPEASPAPETPPASEQAPVSEPAPASEEPAPSDTVAAPAPKFPGGDPFTFKLRLLDRLKLPAGTPAQVRGGIVTVRFTVTAAGKVRDVEVKDIAGTTFDRQIRRLITSSTDWTPAESGGKPVDAPCEMTLKFAFRPDPASGEPHAEDIEVYQEVDTEPLFDSGNADELARRLRARVVAAYPDTNTVPARASVRFIVEKDGTFSRPQIRVRTNGDHKELRQRIIEALRDLPAAAPGRIRDIPVRTQCALTLAFGAPDAVAAEDADEVLSMAETMPSFRGGDLMTFRQWVVANLKYPAALAKEGVTGQVMVSFVIERDGTLSDIRILKSSDPRLSKVVVSVLSASPRWTPGVQYGRKVRVRYTPPLNFHL